jgi:hypothetical protein
MFNGTMLKFLDFFSSFLQLRNIICKKLVLHDGNSLSPVRRFFIRRDGKMEEARGTKRLEQVRKGVL